MLTAEKAGLAEVDAGGVDADQHMLLAAAWETAAHGFVLADATARGAPVIYVNAAFEAMTGYSRGDLVGKELISIYGLETKDATREKFHAALAKGETFDGEFLAYRQDR